MEGRNLKTTLTRQRRKKNRRKMGESRLLTEPQSKTNKMYGCQWVHTLTSFSVGRLRPREGQALWRRSFHSNLPSWAQ